MAESKDPMAQTFTIPGSEDERQKAEKAARQRLAEFNAACEADSKQRRAREAEAAERAARDRAGAEQKTFDERLKIFEDLVEKATSRFKDLEISINLGLESEGAAAELNIVKGCKEQSEKFLTRIGDVQKSAEQAVDILVSASIQQIEAKTKELLAGAAGTIEEGCKVQAQNELGKLSAQADALLTEKAEAFGSNITEGLRDLSQNALNDLSEAIKDVLRQKEAESAKDSSDRLTAERAFGVAGSNGRLKEEGDKGKAASAERLAAEKMAAEKMQADRLTEERAALAKIHERRTAAEAIIAEANRLK